MPRLFVALRPPAALRRRLLDLMDGIDGARWQDDEQLHCTLRFVGEVERPVAEDIAHALGTVRAAPVALALDGIGRFGSRAQGRAVWAGVGPAAPLAALHRKVDAAIVRCGLPPEGRAYLPHVTLARMSARAGPADAFLARHAGLASPTFTVDAFLLYASTLGAEGARYEPVARYRLG